MSRSVGRRSSGRSAGRRSSGRRSRGGGMPLPLALALVALILAAVGFLIARPILFPRAPDPVTFQYNGRTLQALEGVPLNRYDPAAFSTGEDGRKAYKTLGRAAKTGIDVSYFQGEIDWPAVAADGIDFAMLRIGYRGSTEGGLFADQSFETNLAGAKAAGLEVGVYFFSQAVTPEEAAQEARFTLELLAGRPLDRPVAFDWEPAGPGAEGDRTLTVDGETMTACAVAFCEEISRGGYAPMIYLNQGQAYLNYDLTRLTAYPLWLADYRPETDFFYDFDIWQYSHTGAVDGIGTNVDMDLELAPFRPVEVEEP